MRRLMIVGSALSLGLSAAALAQDHSHNYYLDDPVYTHGAPDIVYERTTVDGQETTSVSFAKITNAYSQARLQNRGALRSDGPDPNPTAPQHMGRPGQRQQ
ncbi:MAG: hypothetical protein HUU25_00815 [Candidatus Sumerlaeia bacterium]|nr:hypothetical protein [Candidatus Sumerlaeia bacterium]